jgi:NAD(P)-dependent dehydrogenase (short-subunit alcohol dehydrogenase family)
MAMPSAQTPIGSGFGARTTALEAIDGIDLTGRLAIVTGGYSGLGLETTRALLSAGADVIVPARTLAKAEAALDALLDAGDANGDPFLGELIVADLDLADPQSIDHFTADILELERGIDILINNAAIMACPLARDARGFESQLATNHYGHFQMTMGLLPALLDARDGARVVSLSSIGHARSPIAFEDPHFNERAYDKWSAYGQAKTANALFALELDRRGAAFGLRAFSVHPGGIMTDLQRSLSTDEMRAMGWIDEAGTPNAIFKTPEQGASTTIWCATAPDLDGMGGVYCEDCDIAVAAEAGGGYGPGVRPHARDAEAALKLWDLSERETGAPWATRVVIDG